jgi:hypothetical protein
MIKRKGLGGPKFAATRSNTIEVVRTGNCSEYRKDVQVSKMTTMTNLCTAAVGDLNNDRIKCYNICRTDGWPHEPIQFERVPGRVIADGTKETKSQRIRDYFICRGHVHKQKQDRMWVF